jgi:hypothetical protein
MHRFEVCPIVKTQKSEKRDFYMYEPADTDAGV